MSFLGMSEYYFVNSFHENTKRPILPWLHLSRGEGPGIQRSLRDASRLPLSKVSLWRIFGKGGNLLYRAAKRTIKHEADILPHFNKLIHSNGVGFSGTWNVTEDNP